MPEQAAAGAPAFSFDLADASASAPLVAAAAAALGGLDGVVCCAGSVAFGALDEIPLEILQEIVAVDLVGPLALARAAIPVVVAERLVLAIEHDERDVAASAFAPASTS